VSRNIIFDLDGTLLDSRPGILAGLRQALRSLGHELPADLCLNWAIGPPLLEVMARLLAPLGDARAEEAAACYRDWYRTEGLFDSRPYPGVPEMLECLSGMGKVLFVGTSKRTDFARTVLEHFGLAGRFRCVYGAEPHGKFDRKPDLIRHLLEIERLAVAETALVGDREYDVAAARANGLRMVGVTYGYGSREELEDAALLCDSPELLAELL